MVCSCSNVPWDSLPTVIISGSQTHHQSGQNTPPKWSFSRTTRDPHGDHNHNHHLVPNASMAFLPSINNAKSIA